MKKSYAAIMIALLALIAIAGTVIFVGKDSTAKNETTSSSDTNMSNHDQSGNKPEQTMTAATNSVKIKDFAFNPAKITVKKGTTVTWTNQDSVRHDITPDKKTPNFKASELLRQGESYSFTFTAVGTFSYNCSPHPYMKGSVEVTE